MIHPVVSVAITTYNQEDYIAQTLDSILSQETTFDFEIVIGEDLSTDNTLKIVQEYQKKHPKIIRLLKTDKNYGIELNLLRVIKNCKAKYIAICDGDDYWIDIKKLQKQVDFLEKHTDYGTVTTLRKDFIQDENKFITNQKPFNEAFKTFTFKDVLLKNPVTPSASLFRNSLMTAYIQLYNKHKELSFNDYNFFIFFANKMKLAKLKDITIVYRMLPESGSRSVNGKKVWAFRKRFYKAIKFYMDYFNVPKDLKNKVLYNKAIEFYRFASESKEEQTCKELLVIFKTNRDYIRYFLLKYNLYKLALFVEKVNVRLNYRILKR